MPATAILGAQWGDEAKGKIAHLLSHDAAFAVRFNGGTNAGHRVVFSRIKVGPAGLQAPDYAAAEEFAFHLVPAGALHEDCAAVLANGMVIDLAALTAELDALREFRQTEPEIYISQRAHLLLPYHPIAEALEGSRSALGTTAKGIGPAYRDKVGRWGLRTVDLLDASAFVDKVCDRFRRERQAWAERAEWSQLQPEELAQQMLELAAPLRERIVDTVSLVNNALDEEKLVVFEGAQGALLDIDFGTYPYVTSSTTTVGGVGTGAGVSPSRLDRVVGVTKAYATRVGTGPFPTEDNDTIGAYLRDKGQEFGTTTGRPRRCGWLDLVALRYSHRLNAFTELALMKLDVLSGLKEIRVATAYRCHGQLLPDLPAASEVLERCQPVYESLSGWEEEIATCRGFEELPGAARAFVRFLEDALELPVTMISVGPSADQVIFR